MIWIKATAMSSVPWICSQCRTKNVYTEVGRHLGKGDRVNVRCSGCGKSGTLPITR